MALTECVDISDTLMRESGRIGPEIYNRLIESSPWIRLVEKGEFPEGMGYSINVYTSERVMTTSSDPVWSDITVSTGTGQAACIPTCEEVAFGQTLRAFNLQRRCINGPQLCLEDLRTSWSVREQLCKVMDALTELTDWEWTNRFRNEYLRIVTKVYARAGLPTSGVGPLDNNYPPSSQLTQSILDKIYHPLVREGAGRTAIDRNNGAPVFALITDSETSDQLIKNNSDIRDDFRWCRPCELLAPLGVTRMYRNYVHIIDPYPPRYDYVGGVFIRREPWVSSATTHGNKWDLNPLYEAAEYMVSFIFNRDVFTSLTPRPLTRPGCGVEFDPVSYMGDFVFLNILDKDCNPRGLIGNHNALFASASRIGHPEYGRAIVHKRCPTDVGLITCAYTYYS